MNLFSQILYVADTAVQCLLLVLLLRRGFRKCGVFLLYALGEFASDVCEGMVYYRSGWETPFYRKLYWTDHMTLELLLLLVVISFAYRALHGNPHRSKSTKAIAIILAVTLILPFATLHNHYSKTYGFFTSRWFQHTIQVWSFGAAIMNLVLWTALLTSRRRDVQLVILSIGAGLATSSAAIVWGGRQWLPQTGRWPLDDFLTVAHLATLLVWCWAFRPKTAARAGSATPWSGADPPGNNPYPDGLRSPS